MIARVGDRRDFCTLGVDIYLFTLELKREKILEKKILVRSARRMKLCGTPTGFLCGKGVAKPLGHTPLI